MNKKPTYRLLTQEELSGLEKEFVDYLIINGITADDWERLKKEENEKAEDILTLFSDVVFEGILRKVMFLDHYSLNEIRSFQCLPEKIIMVGLSSENPAHDFTDREFIENSISNPPGGLKTFKSEKKYSKKRELELFDMIQNGATISDDGKLFKSLALIQV